MSCCELLSFFVPLGWFTATRRPGRPTGGLWIAFVLCTFGLIYSITFIASDSTRVVNCFRSLYLWVDLQPFHGRKCSLARCELLSFFVPLGWFTASYGTTFIAKRLWIAFVLCTFGLIYSSLSNARNPDSLWIAFVLCTFGLIYSYQPNKTDYETLWIAFVLCTFGLIYSRWRTCCRHNQLWIAFVLCTFGLIYSEMTHLLQAQSVVNCFRSLYLWVDLQLSKLKLSPCWRCELLSFFVPLGWFTASTLQRNRRSALWIAFVLCTFGLIYSQSWQHRHHTLVVNCFRSLYLWVDLQLHHSLPNGNLCCELLSFFVPLGWFTANKPLEPIFPKLWIAFVLCTFGLIYSPLDVHDFCPRVVNCFRSLYLWVDLQPKNNA